MSVTTRLLLALVALGCGVAAIVVVVLLGGAVLG
jgi:hypothetical protein